MPAWINGESYDGINALYKNAGDWTDAEFNHTIRFSIGSGVSNTCTYTAIGSQYILQFQSGSFGDEGFLPGDNIILIFTYYSGGFTIPIQWAATVDYISGNQMFLVGPIPTAGPLTFPTSGVLSGVLIVADKMPDAIEWQMNLTPNGSSILNSVLDSQINRFEYQAAATLPIGTPQPMTQLTNKSGGWIKDVEITYLGAPGDYTRDFKITYKFIQWGIIKDGMEPPNYYANADNLAPINKIRNFAQFGNPNGIIEAVSTNTEANTGYFDENYNGGINNYTPISIDWFDSLANPIDALDYSGPSTFIAVIDAPNQSNPQSTYRIGLAFRPIDGSQYQNKLTHAGKNLMINAPDLDFIADGVNIPGPFIGEQNDQGAQWDFENLTFTLTGPTELTITGQVTPNGACIAYFSNFPDSERKTTMWVSLGNYNLSIINDDRVSLRLFDEDNIDAPTIGVQIPNVVDEILLDHAQIEITVPDPQTTTEDDVLYRSNLRLIDGIEYEGMRVRISAVNAVTEDEFTLENQFFSFQSVPFIAGQFQPNITQNRGFNLPPASDRNHIKIFREPALDIPGQYGITVEYGWLNDWRYWLEQSNVDNDFFDALEQFNGKNKNWQRFYLPSNWTLRVSYYTQVLGVQDFNHFNFGIRPYEDEPVTTAISIFIPATATAPTNFVANTIHEVTAVLTWAIGAYTNPWAAVTVEDFEAGNRWLLSSVLAQGGISSNPLKPMPGLTELDLQIGPPNVATLKFLMDTNVITAPKISDTYRIYSEDVPYVEWEWLIQSAKDALVGYSVARKLAPDSIYSGPLFRIRRGLDNAELDIDPILVGTEWVTDEAQLLAFTGTTNDSFGWVVKRYDQSSLGNDAAAIALADQALLVSQGVVLKDPDTNRPAMYNDGVNDFQKLNTPIEPEQEMLFISVFNRVPIGPAGQRSYVGFGCLFPDNYAYSMLWVAGPPMGTLGIIYDGMEPTIPNNVHFTAQQQYGAQLNMVWRNPASQIQMRLNGVAGNTLTIVGFDDWQYTTTERQRNRHHVAPKSEDIAYGRDRVQTTAWIENNVNNFYQIF